MYLLRGIKTFGLKIIPYVLEVGIFSKVSNFPNFLVRYLNVPQDFAKISKSTQESSHIASGVLNKKSTVRILLFFLLFYFGFWPFFGNRPLAYCRICWTTKNTMKQRKSPYLVTVNKISSLRSQKNKLST